MYCIVPSPSTAYDRMLFVPAMLNPEVCRPSCTDYHPPYPTSSQLQQQQDPSNAQLSVLDSQIHAGQSSYPTDPIDYYETNNTIQQYNVQQQQQLGDSMFSTPMLLDSAPIASHPVSAFATHNITVPYINTNVEAYPPNDWNEHATTTSRAHILGSPSITPPPHHAYVEGPIHDLNQLDRSATLRGIHEDRYKRTVSTVNDLSAAVISRGSPTNGQVASLPASPETASPVSAKGKGPASPPGRNGSTASTGDSKNPCPWPGCDGTRDTNLFESNRLKWVPQPPLPPSPSPMLCTKIAMADHFEKGTLASKASMAIHVRFLRNAQGG